jgi:hypothetical protein
MFAFEVVMKFNLFLGLWLSLNAIVAISLFETEDRSRFLGMY